MDDLGERSQDELRPDASHSGHTRRDFLKRAAGVALAVPAAGAVVDAAAAARRIERRRDRAAVRRRDAAVREGAVRQ